MSKNEEQTDICIIGGGMVGLAAALKLAQTTANITLCAPRQPIKDGRTTALLMQTVVFFEDLGIWSKISDKAFPLKTMRIIDNTNRLIRPPQTDFHASEIDLEAFGYNVKNSDILEIMENIIESYSNINWLEGVVESIVPNDDRESITVKTKSGISHVSAGFLVGADGRNSIVRETKDKRVKEWQYPQTALVVDFEHERSTQYTSTEFHTESGPFTIVPHSHNKAGLVWMETPANVQETMLLSKEELEVLLEKTMQSFLGKIKLATEPQSFPIKGMIADSFGEKNWALIGEAAHVFPPIGAQGFNLGIRDIEALSEVLSRFTNQENRGQQYHQARKHDVNTRTYGVDLLNRSLLSDFMPIQMIRGLGLHLLGSIKPLRKYAMRMGISPSL